MGILQLQLQAGRNYVQLHQSIARTPFRIQSYAMHFNVENHGFYIARVRFPTTSLGTMNARNNLYDNTEIILPVDHTKSFFSEYIQWELGPLNFPASFDISVDFDSGIQIVPIENTGLAGPVNYDPVTGMWTPAGATGNNQFSTLAGFGHSQAITNEPVASGTILDAAADFVSVGLSSDLIQIAGDNALAAYEGWNGATAPISATGDLQGFIPFCYSLILTLEYDGSSTEARVQNLY